MSWNYPSSYYQFIHHIQERHFWFLARNEILSTCIARYLRPKAKILEIGCGTGIVMRHLESFGYAMTGIDVNKQAIIYARTQTSGPLIQQSIYTFRSPILYDGVGAFDVLEHQRDDIRFLKKVHTLLRPGGYFFITVPAGPYLWTHIDTLSGHERRYDPQDLLEKLKRTGYTIHFWNYWNWITFPLYVVRRWMIQSDDRSTIIPMYVGVPNYIMNRILYTLLRLEAKMFYSIRPPFGSSLVICAQKSQQ